ncbi:MAG: EAL domain-containing protein [Actinomycetia bacterium]|nr:EAL domain-containing protein [Actinomycetes bacterium]
MHPTQRVLGLIVLLVALDIALLANAWDQGPTFDDVALPAIVLVPLFALVEWRVIHVQFRAEASSFSLLEIPLVVGLLYVPPRLVVGAAVLGMMIGLRLGRHQPWIKVAFNVANVALFALVASLLLRATATDAYLDRATWAAVFLATTAGGVATLLIIMIAIGLTEGAVDRHKASELILAGTIMSGANTAVGLAAALLLPIDGLSVALLIAPGALVLGTISIFASERAQRERVQFLYRSSRNLDFADSDDGLQALLNEAREMFRAEVGAVLLLGDDDSPARLVRYSDAGGQSEVWPSGLDPDTVADLITTIDEPLMIEAGSDSPLEPAVAEVGGRDAMVAKLATDDQVQGVLIIANPIGDISSFSTDDLQVLGALARQSAVLLHSDQLEQALLELQKLERKLAHQATHDSLTGLPNRSLFDSRLDDAAASHESFTVLFIDLDDFKIVNDTHGHAAGDLVLNEVAQRLSSLVRPIDTVARLGGDEFAMLVRSSSDPRRIADRVVKRLTEEIHLDGYSVVVGCSVGLAKGTDEMGTNQLLRDADQAMYAAKEAGKGSVVEHFPGDTSPRYRRSNDDQAAIPESDLVVHYQPVIDIDNQRVAGVEALVRWRSPDRGLVLPSEFITQAERDGSVIPIDRWVLRRALDDQARLVSERSTGAEAGRFGAEEPFFVAVNLSARHLAAKDLPAFVDSLEPSGGFGGRLVVEVSETALIADADQEDSVISAMRRRGIRVAFDDFGTGYSSLSYLRRFDIDMMKLAKPLIDRAVDSKPDRQVLGAIIELGQAIGLRVTAKGIEESEQAELLARLGCDLAQGYLLARPMPIESLQTMLARQAPSTPGSARPWNLI